MKKFKHTLVLAGALFSTSLATAPAATATETVSHTGSTYQVVAGDNMTTIAKKFGVSLSALLSANSSIQAPYVIYVGQTIRIPNQQATSAASNTQNAGSYQVVAGDTMWSIAEKLGVSFSALLAANPNMQSPDLIYVGQTLQVPGPNAQAQTAAQTSTPIQADIVKQAVAAPTASGVNVARLIATAEQYQGTPYIWGGSTPSGFDCSGFTQFVYQELGVSLPRTSEEQNVAVTPVSTPAPGDLVFFSTYEPGPSHVGIYIGGGKFISSTITYGIHIDSLSNPYWGPRYLGAGRV